MRGFLGLQYAIQQAFIDIVYAATNEKYLDYITALEKSGDVAKKVKLKLYLNLKSQRIFSKLKIPVQKGKSGTPKLRFNSII